MFVFFERCRRSWFPLVMLFAFLSVASLRSAAQSPAKNIVDLQGHAVNPFEGADGKITVFLFVRTDCPISNRYAPTIQELSSHFGKSAKFFLVYPIRSESPVQIRKHLKEYGYQITALRDPDLELVRAAHVKVTPESAVFAPDGRLLYHGRIDNWYTEFARARPVPTTHELFSAVEAAIAGREAAVRTAPAIGCFLPGTP